MSSLQVHWLSLLILVSDNFSGDTIRLSKKERGKKDGLFNLFFMLCFIFCGKKYRKKKKYSILAGVFWKAAKFEVWPGMRVKKLENDLEVWKNDLEVEPEYFLRAKPVVRMDLCNNSLQLMAIAQRMHQKSEGDCMSVSLLGWTTSGCFCCRLLWNHTRSFLYTLPLFLRRASWPCYCTSTLLIFLASSVSS